jgi:serine/threonine protein kinase
MHPTTPIEKPNDRFFSMRSRQADGFVQRLKSIADRFLVIAKIGGGTYGEVHKCRDQETGDIVAVKRIIILHPDDGFPNTTLREVQLLRELTHDNIIALKFVVQSEDEKEPGIYLVFDYCEYDLYAVLNMPETPKPSRLWLLSFMKQFLVALHFLAIHRVAHRDLKPANMFVTRAGVLKLGDFGLARKLTERGRLSDKVITLWYRPPELLLGFKKRYETEVDIWSAGCILYEMVTSKPLFQARDATEMSQLLKIFSVSGLPQIDEWPEFYEFDAAGYWKNQSVPRESQLQDLLRSNIGQDFIGIVEVLVSMLQLNPARRISAEDALNHSFFRELGSSTDPKNLPELKWEEMHQLKASERKKKDKEKERERERVKQELPRPPELV